MWTYLLWDGLTVMVTNYVVPEKRNANRAAKAGRTASSDLYDRDAFLICHP
jgi:hypothetical protein